MDNELVIRGKRITPDVLWQIKSVVERSWKKGRTAISKELCCGSGSDLCIMLKFLYKCSKLGLMDVLESPF